MLFVAYIRSVHILLCINYFHLFLHHQLRALYSQYLRRTKSLNNLLYHLFRLMPENPDIPGSTAEFPNKDAKTYFSEELRLDIKGQSDF